MLIETLKACGAEVAWSGCNPLSTNDAVSAALALGPKGDGDGVEIYAWYGQDTEAFYWCIDRTIDKTPDTTLDDGADLIFRVHSAFPEKLDDIIGGSEETTTGVHRLRAMADDGKLGYPVYAVNDAETKWDFDNVYGTGQSTLDGILRASVRPDRGQELRRGGLRPLRPRRRDAGQGHGRERDRDRGQADRRPQGDARRHAGDDDGAGRHASATSS